MAVMFNAIAPSRRIPSPVTLRVEAPQVPESVADVFSIAFVGDYVAQRLAQHFPHQLRRTRGAEDNADSSTVSVSEEEEKKDERMGGHRCSFFVA
jgi:hypothetical protein